ncbi:hypothetical protein [Photobacterium gaetbulicola]|uniref:hypothetical protein n=1 Tax=Photobacterium gaetbulicola TaxID=1295392 RepID=UPI0011B210E5|nr:hypothetical protein [Photobacterium gaetbulicola]
MRWHQPAFPSGEVCWFFFRILYQVRWFCDRLVGAGHSRTVRQYRCRSRRYSLPFPCWFAPYQGSDIVTPSVIPNSWAVIDGYHPFSLYLLIARSGLYRGTGTSPSRRESGCHRPVAFFRIAYRQAAHLFSVAGVVAPLRPGKVGFLKSWELVQRGRVDTTAFKRQNGVAMLFLSCSGYAAATAPCPCIRPWFIPLGYPCRVAQMCLQQ